jgi:hypothetical protein
MHLPKHVNCKIDPIQTWYHALWKQKDMYQFYKVHNSVVSPFKNLVFGSSTSKLYLEVATFLDKRGNFKAMEQFGVIWVYYSKEIPSYLPYYVSDKMFVS